MVLLNPTNCPKCIPENPAEHPDCPKGVSKGAALHGVASHRSAQDPGWRVFGWILSLARQWHNYSTFCFARSMFVSVPEPCYTLPCIECTHSPFAIRHLLIRHATLPDPCRPCPRRGSHPPLALHHDRRAREHAGSGQGVHRRHPGRVPRRDAQLLRLRGRAAGIDRADRHERRRRAERHGWAPDAGRGAGQRHRRPRGGRHPLLRRHQAGNRRAGAGLQRRRQGGARSSCPCARKSP